MRDEDEFAHSRSINALSLGKQYTRYDNNIDDWRTVPAKTGDTFIFPGWLRHRTQENTLDKERWVLTTNFNRAFTK